MNAPAAVPTEVNLTRLASWVLTVTADPDLGTSHKAVILIGWREALSGHRLGGLTDEDAIAIARAIVDEGFTVTAHVNPF